MTHEVSFCNFLLKLLKLYSFLLNEIKYFVGMLLIDEMKLSKTLSFNRQNLKVEGFTNLGKYTPENKKNTKGDHALVIMFQPFKGGWVQTLACFLSNGSACGSVLHQIIVECIILTERTGLFVDGVVTDGATWNRSMWNLFGVSPDEVSVEHIVDPNRRLWFCSDFPHLIKCFRNFLTKHQKYEKIWVRKYFTNKTIGKLCLFYEHFTSS